MKGRRPGRLYTLLKGITVFFETVLTVLLTVIFSLTVLLVILRYVFNTTILGGSELIGFLFIYTTALGAALLIGRNEHIRITTLLDILPPLLQRILRFIIAASTLALHILLCRLSFRWISSAGDFLTPILRIPQAFVQAAVPLGCGLAIVYLCMEFVNLILVREETVDR